MHVIAAIDYSALNTYANIGTFLLLLASVVAAAVSLHHAASFNQISAVISMERDLRGAEMQEALRFVQYELPFKMHDERFRGELDALGFIDARVHQEVQACQWFNAVGTLLKNNLVDESAWMDLFARLTVAYWDTLEPAIAIMRRRRGDWQFANFEYMAVRAKEWLKKHPHGTFPHHTARAKVQDKWLAADTALRSGQTS
ncbi:MAG: hypothetical protein JO343_03750 [Candidatus Eremiobacteraeota bacterium]|nr:hypothetical protein [Candidatus Eremiobacteraeota bacterium]